MSNINSLSAATNYFTLDTGVVKEMCENGFRFNYWKGRAIFHPEVWQEEQNVEFEVNILKLLANFIL